MSRNYRVYLKVVISLFLVFYACSSEETGGETEIDESPSVIKLATLHTNEAEDISATGATIWSKITDNGGGNITERGVCYGLSEKPTYDGLKEKPTVVKGSGEFQVLLTGLEDNLVYYARAYAVNGKGISYGNQVNFSTEVVILAKFEIKETRIAGAHDIFIDVELKETGDLEIQESGIVYGLSGQPTVDDDKMINDMPESMSRYRITDLSPETVYFIRPYVVTSKGVSYNDIVTVSTIKKGNFTWSFWNEDPNADAETKAAYTRIRAAFDEATEYYNNFTSIEKHVNVNYSPGTPTADANFSGWINMGANSSYQKTGTAMHEMAHTVGVGTHAKYWELMKGNWQGIRANDILKMMNNNPNGLISGDATHFWPYGINGAHEDTGDSMLYIKHALIIQGMKTDGLPSN